MFRGKSGWGNCDLASLKGGEPHAALSITGQSSEPSLD